MMSEADTPARPSIPTEATDLVSLRELEQRFHSLQKLIDERTRYEREILSTRENLMKDAIEIAGIETKRRLDELNHAHQEARMNWQTSLPREMFDQFLQEYRVWRDGVNVNITGYSNLGPRLIDIAKRMERQEEQINQATGALVLIRFMGFAGVIALLVSFLRMANVIP